VLHLAFAGLFAELFDVVPGGARLMRALKFAGLIACPFA
jgi:hypothetical protein